MEPEKLLYAKTHEWAHIEDLDGQQVATVGISAFAVEQLTDLVFMELPEVGRTVAAGESIGEIESVKAVSDFYSPVDGEIIEANVGLPDDLDVLGTDPYTKGWIVKIKVEDGFSPSALMDYAAYQKQCETAG